MVREPTPPLQPHETTPDPPRASRLEQCKERSDANAISMTGLTKHYKGVQALTGLTLDVPAGTVFGFLGPNGAGKTTAMKVLAGLARATAGTAPINGSGSRLPAPTGASSVTSPRTPGSTAG